MCDITSGLEFVEAGLSVEMPHSTLSTIEFGFQVGERGIAHESIDQRGGSEGLYDQPMDGRRRDRAGSEVLFVDVQQRCHRETD